MNPYFPRLALRACLCITFAASCLPAQAHDYYAKFFHVYHPWAEPTEPGAENSAVYLKFDEISADDKLIGAKTLLADRVELRGPVDADVPGSTGKLLDGISLASGSELELRPGTMRLMLMGLKQPLQWGRSYPMTLEFEKSGMLIVTVSVGTP